MRVAVSAVSASLWDCSSLGPAHGDKPTDDSPAQQEIECDDVPPPLITIRYHAECRCKIHQEEWYANQRDAIQEQQKRQDHAIAAHAAIITPLGLRIPRAWIGTNTEGHAGKERGSLESSVIIVIPGIAPTRTLKLD
jgi:hypothetical protein